MMTRGTKGWKQSQGRIIGNTSSIKLGLHRTLMLRWIRNKLILIPEIGLQSLWKTPITTLKNTESQVRYTEGDEWGKEAEREKDGSRQNEGEGRKKQ